MQLGDCPYCKQPVTSKLDSYYEITAWVDSKAGKGSKLAEQTGRWAHGQCVRSAAHGIMPDQVSMFV